MRPQTKRKTCTAFMVTWFLLLVFAWSVLLGALWTDDTASNFQQRSGQGVSR